MKYGGEKLRFTSFKDYVRIQIAQANDQGLMVIKADFTIKKGDMHIFLEHVEEEIKKAWQREELFVPEKLVEKQRKESLELKDIGGYF